MTEEHERFCRALENVASEWLCPIAHELPFDPVMAEDSRFYERAEIEEWFRRNESAILSPVTNEPMGDLLKAVPQVRNTIQNLVDSGAITGDKAESWRERLAQEQERLAQEEEVRLLRQGAADSDVDAMRTLAFFIWVAKGGFRWMMLRPSHG
jgi:hypothetical protein